MSDRTPPEHVDTRELDTNIINNLEGVPTIFIDGMQGSIGINDVVRINLYQVVQELPSEGQPGTLRKLVVGRLAMSPSTLAQCVAWLNSITAARGDSGANES